MNRDGPHFHGALKSHVAGRTDHLPIRVSNGAYVLPADIVSSMGEGNTDAGFKAVEHIFGIRQHAAGITEHKIPIMAAGGEYVIHPEDVKRIGNGDMKHGHDVLDQFVKHRREALIKTLKKLPGPAKK